MTRPTTFLLRMGLFLLAVIALAASMAPTLTHAFQGNPKLISVILGVLVLGILWNLRVVQRLMPEVSWVEMLRQSRAGLTAPNPPRLLAPMASMLASRSRSDKLSLSTHATQAMLDSLSSRLDESREISRYVTQLPIFLGLLGTFYGLLLTVSSIASVISGMSAGSGDLDAMFGQLKTGLAAPLGGMSTAFSASMFGLACALVLGFLDLTAGQAQSRFFNELEEWLAGLTRVGSGGNAVTENDGAPIPTYVQALLEQTAENLETLQNAVSRGEEGRVRELELLDGLQERLRGMTELLRANQQIMTRTAETQAELGSYLQKLHGTEHNAPLERIEGQLARMGEDLKQGRLQTTGELRNDLRILARTIAASSGTSVRQD
ncbi:MotA/TolQ/ExbB proton channel family protein [Neokomagataea thailandica NBRC 106555]|uniref:Flagellar motor protein MotA n=2 Tax=Neokomagataea TaxID=1223423 RepID=A0A4Y6V1Y6_9PROT|nr:MULTISPECIES: flagellar motor protein MotA [Neokomagataea]QDH24039.1 flagellar motor protein MotA [Neokomagataea tanensis]GBR50220.1 MotA/TolQ/ExbB proton channel family protein [Neokomagataea thailandica NBRC 106555]